jgi:hypothetical protein
LVDGPNSGSVIFGLQFESVAGHSMMQRNHMTLFAKIFTTKRLVQIIAVLAAVMVMKELSAHYEFSWAAALAG